VSVDGLSIRYWTNEASRDKGTVVLFHGNAFSLDNWKSAGTLDALTKLGYAVFAIDLPIGRGSKSQKISDPSSSEIVSWVTKIFDAVGIKTPVTIIGPSMGGGVALSFALSHPDKLNALVLVSPAVGSLASEERNKVSDLDVPVLLLWGDRDNVFPLAEYGKPLKEEFRHSKLLIISGAGHAAYLDKPQEFNEIVSDFLAEVL
jgi:abhydrolase domain-containing protein 14